MVPTKHIFEGSCTLCLLTAALLKALQRACLAIDTKHTEVLLWITLSCHNILQENYFFDGPNKELNSRFVVLRLRFYDTDKKAVLTLKVCCRKAQV